MSRYSASVALWSENFLESGVSFFFPTALSSTYFFLSWKNVPTASYQIFIHRTGEIPLLLGFNLGHRIEELARVTLAEDGTYTLIVFNLFLSSIQQLWTVKCINSIQGPEPRCSAFDLLVIWASAMQHKRNY